MRPTLLFTTTMLMAVLVMVLHASDEPGVARAQNYKTQNIAGWTVHVSRELLTNESKLTERALDLLRIQLEEIVRDVPKGAVVELQKVTLWFSPGYPKVQQRAEYHPNVHWLSKNGRDPGMAKGIEFTNVRIFEAETNRMRNFALHELSHAYHDRVLPLGFGNVEIINAYQAAIKSGAYIRVERWHGNGKRNTFERAYAMTTPQEYFAESTEALFSRNDFFPFTKEELKQHDPAMFKLLSKLWGVASDINSTPSKP